MANAVTIRKTGKFTRLERKLAANLRKSSAICVSECAGTAFKRITSSISLVCEMENHESHVCCKCGIKETRLCYVPNSGCDGSFFCKERMLYINFHCLSSEKTQTTLPGTGTFRT